MSKDLMSPTNALGNMLEDITHRLVEARCCLLGNTTNGYGYAEATRIVQSVIDNIDEVLSGGKFDDSEDAQKARWRGIDRMEPTPEESMSHELAGLTGEIMGLRVTAGFFQRRCEVMEKLFADERLTETEQDVLKGCCPVCGPRGVVCRGCGLTVEEQEEASARFRGQKLDAGLDADRSVSEVASSEPSKSSDS